MPSEVVKFEAEHVWQLTDFGGQDRLAPFFTEEDLNDMADAGPAITVLKDGKVIGCGGLVEMTQYRALVWALFSKTTPANFLLMHRASVKMLRSCKYKRVEAFVDPNFPAAMRWIKQLGFTMEQAYVPFYFPDGSGASSWALYQDNE